MIRAKIIIDFEGGDHLEGTIPFQESAILDSEEMNKVREQLIETFNRLIS